MYDETFESVKISKNKLNYYKDIYEKTKETVIIDILKILENKDLINNIKDIDLKL